MRTGIGFGWWGGDGASITPASVPRSSDGFDAASFDRPCGLCGPPARTYGGLDRHARRIKPDKALLTHLAANLVPPSTRSSPTLPNTQETEDREHQVKKRRLDRGKSTLTADRLRVHCAQRRGPARGRSLNEQTMHGKRLSDPSGFRPIVPLEGLLDAQGPCGSGA
jgi:hypothetical protein